MGGTSHALQEESQLDERNHGVLPCASTSLTASAGATIGIPSKLFIDSRSSSPDTMTSTLAASASAST